MSRQSTLVAVASVEPECIREPDSKCRQQISEQGGEKKGRWAERASNANNPLIDWPSLSEAGFSYYETP